MKSKEIAPADPEISNTLQKNQTNPNKSDKPWEILKIPENLYTEPGLYQTL